MFLEETRTAQRLRVKRENAPELSVWGDASSSGCSGAKLLATWSAGRVFKQP